MTAPPDVERDGLGSTEIRVSDAVTAHAYDDEDGAVLVDTAARGPYPEHPHGNV